jgi:hypothetical protein
MTLPEGARSTQNRFGIETKAKMELREKMVPWENGAVGED